MTGLYEDFRYGFRALAKHRRYTAVCVLSLALGIGANTTIFTLVNALLFRSLPVPDASHLSAMYTLDSRNPGFWGVSYPNYRDYRDRNPVFSSLLAYTVVGFNLTGGPEPHMVVGQLASDNYFSTLGVNAALGRSFLPEENAAGNPSLVAVISYRFWRQEFGGDPGVLTRNLNLNGRPYRIIGVAPEGFLGLDTLMASDIWVPMELYRDLYPVPNMLNQRRYLVPVSYTHLDVYKRQADGRPAPRSIPAYFPREHKRESAAGRETRAPLLPPGSGAGRSSRPTASKTPGQPSPPPLPGSQNSFGPLSIDQGSCQSGLSIAAQLPAK